MWERKDARTPPCFEVLAPSQHRFLQGLAAGAAKVEGMGVGADSEDELDPWQSGEQLTMP